MASHLAIDLYHLRLDMRRPLGTAAGDHRARPVIFVRIETDEGEGWGEAAALPEGTSVDPTLDAVWDELSSTGLPRLLEATAARHGELPSASLVASLFGSGPVSRMAGAALEMAVLDAELRAAGVSLGERLGARRTRVPVGVVLGIPADRDLSDLLRQAESAVEGGAARLRVKIEPGWDDDPVAALRRHFPELLLQADANGAYRLEGITDPLTDARRLAALDEYGLTCIEQPLPPADLPAHGALGELLGTPICLDESLTTRRRVVDAIRYGACRVACLKPARLGGFFATLQVLALCREAELRAFVGGFFETSFARSANVALAATDGFDLPGDLSAPADYLDSEPFGPDAYPRTGEGGVAVPTAPGVGPRPEKSLVEARTVRVLRRTSGPSSQAPARRSRT